MELSAGYKNTEVGVIPEDWEVKQLCEIVKPERLISYGIVQTGKLIPNGVKCVRVVDIIDGEIDVEKMITTSIEISNSYQRTILQKNDLMIALRGKIGEVAITEDNLIGSNLTRGVALISLREIYNPKFIQQQLKSSKSKSILESNLNGSALKELSISILRKIPISLPPTKAEQATIANALSDTDALISGLEKLIAKKRNIKQGAMQKLLQPKEGWEVKKLGEVIYLQGGYAFKSELFTNVGIPIIRISDVENNSVNTEGSVCYEPFNIPKEFIAKKGDVLIAMSGATTGKIGVYNNAGIAYINQRVGKFTVLNDSKTSQEFISHIVRSEKFKENLVKEIAQGAQPNISGKQIQSIVLPIPNDKEEQIYIATILSDMDNEITALENKLEKYRKVKLGMMQNLLTGKIRLI